jgi:hypothetical protein
MMTSATDECDQLLTIGRTSFASGRYEVAFYALHAAYHCAQDVVDAVRLQQVLTELEGQHVGLQARLRAGQQRTNRRATKDVLRLYDLSIRTIKRAINRMTGDVAHGERDV